MSTNRADIVATVARGRPLRQPPQYLQFARTVTARQHPVGAGKADLFRELVYADVIPEWCDTEQAHDSVLRSPRSEVEGQLAKRGNELVIAMVGALGTDLEVVQSLIEKALDEVGYKHHSLRLSQLIQAVPGYPLDDACKSEQHDVRLEALMDAGNDIRQKLGGDALAKLAVMRIRAIRQEVNGGRDPEDSSVPLLRTAYVIRSLKHPDEVEFLRSIYGDSFFFSFR